MKPNVRPLIDDVAAVELRNYAYEADDAWEKFSKERDEYNQEQFRQEERHAFFKMKRKILSLVPPPPFDDSPLDVPTDYVLSNADCYLLLNFIDFLTTRKLMPEITLSEAKKLLVDYDCNMGACD